MHQVRIKRKRGGIPLPPPWYASPQVEGLVLDVEPIIKHDSHSTYVQLKDCPDNYMKLQEKREFLTNRAKLNIDTRNIDSMHINIEFLDLICGFTNDSFKNHLKEEWKDGEYMVFK